MLKAYNVMIGITLILSLYCILRLTYSLGYINGSGGDCKVEVSSTGITIITRI